MNLKSVFSQKVDWKWVGIGLCFYIVFHLLPTYLLVTLVSERLPFMGSASRGAGIGGGYLSFSIWVFVGLALIGCYIGFRSSGITILEPGISALLYVIVFFVGSQSFWGGSASMSSFVGAIAWMASAFVVAVTSAWIGEILQSQKEQKTT
jgi:hypothetical protein